MPSSIPDCDLHPFIRDPDRARAILDACITDSIDRGIFQIRVVHGKGTGNFRKLVHSHLDRHPDVEGYILCDPQHGGSGASWVHLIGESYEEEKNPDESMDESWDEPIDEPIDESMDEAVDDIDQTSKPARPFWRWILYFFFLVLAFMVFPQWFFRAILVLFIFFLEIRTATRDHEE